MAEKRKAARTRRPYQKLQLEQVQLVAEEAVLQNCKVDNIGGANGPNCRQADGGGGACSGRQS
jgi:hypothetical protein